MGSYALHRTASAAATLAAASVAIFFFIHLVPGDPLYVLLGDTATPDQVEALRSKFGLDQPIVIQYFRCDSIGSPRGLPTHLDCCP